jgi:hypothetical protein
MASKRPRPASTTAEQPASGKRQDSAAPPGGTAQPASKTPSPAAPRGSGGPSGSQQNAKTNAARKKAAALRAEQARREKRRQVLGWSAGIGSIVVLAVVVIVLVVTVGNDKPSATSTSADVATSTLTGPQGPEGIVLEQGTVLAPVTAAANGETVDGVKCEAQEQVVYHIHAHLTIYVNGTMRPVPPGIGIVEPQNSSSAGEPEMDSASECYYWLHTHAQDGVIHIEAPNSATYTLGNFFGIWKQTLTATQVGSASGKVTAYVNGKLFTGDPATIPLTSRADIQLDVGSTTPAPQKVDWSISQL